MLVSNTIKKILIYFLAALILCWSHAAYAGNKLRLPKSYGPLYLGMSVKEFKTVVDVSIGRCVDCVEDQLEADLLISKRLAEGFSINMGKRLEPVKLKDAYIKFQAKEMQPEMVVCFFYKNALYGIVMSNVKGRLELVKNSYIKALGNPTAIDVWDSGLSQLRWEDSSTRLSVVYSTNTAGIDYLEISYTDLKIVSKIPERKD